MTFPLTRRLLAFDEVYSLAHGLTTADIGKPIGWKANGKPEVWPDHASPQTSYPAAMLTGIVNANTLKLSTGDVLEVPNAILPSGMPVNGTETNSRFLFWDQSAGAWVHTMPTDSKLITEGIYWIGASPTSGYSICINLMPNRPATGDAVVGTSGTTGGTSSGSFRIVANKAARLAISPLAAGDRVRQDTMGIVYTYDGVSWFPEGHIGLVDTLPAETEAHVGSVVYNRANHSMYALVSGTWTQTLP